MEWGRGLQELEVGVLTLYSVLVFLYIDSRYSIFKIDHLVCMKKCAYKL